MLPSHSKNYLKVKRWRAENPEKWRLQRKRYYEEHKAQIEQRHKEWRVETDYDKNYHEQHRDRIIARKKQHYRQNREKLLMEKRAYTAKHKDEISARDRARYNIMLESQCLLCNSNESLERHHPDYSKPLFVVTLCRSCHRKLHAKGNELLLSRLMKLLEPKPVHRVEGENPFNV